MILDTIQKANDIKNVPEDQLAELANEIRTFLIEKVSTTGGHLASNLGVVELTIALHRMLNLPEDQIVWDVGHQSYTHKLLTGRKDGFDHLRCFGGMSGFPKRSESDCDVFDTGHSSTSISAGLGLVRSRDLLGQDHTVVSVIGDGSMTGGMAFEAINDAAQLKTNFIIVLNDNNMSISRNVGGLSHYLNSLRTTNAYYDFKERIINGILKLPNGEKTVKSISRTKSSIKQLLLPGMLFEELGLTYLGPVDGHDIQAMGQVLQEARRVRGAVLVHVLTTKGKGYTPAEEDPAKFHGIGPFDPETGASLGQKKLTYTEVFSRTMQVLGKEYERLTAITAAMPDGTGLSDFAKKYPERYFDVGIAEQHAVTMAAGMAAGGLIPVFAVYSSFLQRAFDQIIHDVCLQNLHVIFAVDRAGLVGQDGETHQGIFDLSFLSTIPNMTVMAPSNKWTMIDMLHFAVEHDGPIAIRYPRGTACELFEKFRYPVEHGKGVYLYEESEIAILAVGTMVKSGDLVRRKLKELGMNCSLIDMRFIKPIDEELIRHAAGSHKLLVTMEENVLNGGFGQKVEHLIEKEELSADVLTVTLPDEYVEHGDFESLKKELNLDEDSIVSAILVKCIGA